MGWQNVPNNRSLLAASVDVRPSNYKKLEKKLVKITYILVFVFQIICKNASLYTSIILKKHAELDMYSGEKGFQISEEVCIVHFHIKALFRNENFRLDEMTK